MTNRLYEYFTYVVRENNELTTKLQLAEAENTSLKSANERLNNGLSTLGEKLEDANNEIARLGMVLKHRARDMESVRRVGKQWSPLAAARHH